VLNTRGTRIPRGWADHGQRGEKRKERKQPGEGREKRWPVNCLDVEGEKFLVPEVIRGLRLDLGSIKTTKKGLTAKIQGKGGGEWSTLQEGKKKKC